jgi:hypothetical protein
LNALIGKFIIFMALILQVGCGNSDPVSKQGSSCTNSINLGHCMSSANINFDTKEWRALSALDKNGNSAVTSNTVNGQCVVTVKFSGTHDGNSYNKSISCPVTW